MNLPRLRFLSSVISRPVHAKYLRTSRRLHTPIPLPYPVESGLGRFLPPDALKTIAVDYQEGILERLNDEVRGTENENISVAQTVINTAGEPTQVLAHSYASLALNNSFFLDRLRPPPLAPKKNHQDLMSEGLYTAINAEYGSMTSFKSTFSAAVSGLSTNGWIWFVVDQDHKIGIYPTFGPRTLLLDDARILPEDAYNPEPRAHEEDLSEESHTVWPAQSPTPQPSPPGVSPSSPASGVSGSGIPTEKTLGPRFYHTTRRSSYEFSSPSSLADVEEEVEEEGEEEEGFYTWNNEADREEFAPSSKGALLHSGKILLPLFCVPVYEHAWLSAGFGVWGKEEWIKHYWSVLDWEKVSRDYDNYTGMS